ncbi:retrovirus-related pol polyprotein from transposon TNT 1-94 [Tanacetum coccineum]
MKMIHIHHLISSLFTISTHAAAQDFCVADLQGPESPAGNSCKSPANVIVDDFLSCSLMFTANTSNIIKATVTHPTFAAQLPGVNGSEILLVTLGLLRQVSSGLFLKDTKRRRDYDNSDPCPKDKMLFYSRKGQIRHTQVLEFLLSPLLEEILQSNTTVSRMSGRNFHQFRQTEKFVELVDKPFGKMIIKLKWLWKNKKDEDQTVIRNKARLVAKGYVPPRKRSFVDFEESCAPVLAWASCSDFRYALLKHTSPFLSSKFGRIKTVTFFYWFHWKEEVYVAQPEGQELVQAEYAIVHVIRHTRQHHKAHQARYFKTADHAGALILGKSTSGGIPVPWLINCQAGCQRNKTALQCLQREAESGCYLQVVLK